MSKLDSEKNGEKTTNAESDNNEENFSTPITSMPELLCAAANSMWEYTVPEGDVLASLESEGNDSLSLPLWERNRDDRLNFLWPMDAIVSSLLCYYILEVDCTLATRLAWMMRMLPQEMCHDNRLVTEEQNIVAEKEKDSDAKYFHVIVSQAGWGKKYGVCCQPQKSPFFKATEDHRTFQRIDLLTIVEVLLPNLLPRNMAMDNMEEGEGGKKQKTGRYLCCSTENGLPHTTTTAESNGDDGVSSAVKRFVFSAAVLLADYRVLYLNMPWFAELMKLRANPTKEEVLAVVPKEVLSQEEKQMKFFEDFPAGGKEEDSDSDSSDAGSEVSIHGVFTLLSFIANLAALGSNKAIVTRIIPALYVPSPSQFNMCRMKDPKLAWTTDGSSEHTIHDLLKFSNAYKKQTEYFPFFPFSLCLRLPIMAHNDGETKFTILQCLIEHGWEVKKFLAEPCFSMFHVAAGFGNAEFLHLLSSVMDPNQPITKKKKSETFWGIALHLACFFGNIETAKYLCTRSYVDVNAKLKGTEATFWLGATPFYLACKTCPPLAKYFLEDNNVPKMDFNEPKHNGGTAFYCSCKDEKSLPVMQLFLEQQGKGKINYTAKRDNGQNALWVAAANDNIEAVDQLLKLKGVFDPNDTDHLGRTPFFIACKKQNMGIVKRLCEEGPSILDVNKPDLPSTENAKIKNAFLQQQKKSDDKEPEEEKGQEDQQQPISLCPFEVAHRPIKDFLLSKREELHLQVTPEMEKAPDFIEKSSTPCVIS